MASNKAAVLTIENPRRHSGQEYIRYIYDAMQALRGKENRVMILWTRAHAQNELLEVASRRHRGDQNWSHAMEAVP